MSFTSARRMGIEDLRRFVFVSDSFPIAFAVGRVFTYLRKQVKMLISLVALFFVLFVWYRPRPWSLFRWADVGCCSR